jgi:uncharacterized protein YjdB
MALMWTACSDDEVTAPANVQSVTVRPLAAFLEVGASVHLTATVTGKGKIDPGVTWTSSAPTVATVSSGGDVLGVSEGTAVITAKSIANAGKLAVAAITVISGEVSSVEVAPNPARVIRGSTTQLSAIAYNGSDGVVPDRPVLWAIDNPLIATVSSSGMLTGVAFGAANVTATVDGVSGTAEVVVGVGSVSRVIIQPATLVLEQGEITNLAARPFDAVGNVVDDADVFWTSSDPSIVTVSELGEVTAVALGTARITARAQAAEGSATITVVAATIARMRVSPRPTELEAGESIQLAAVVQDGNGVPLSSQPAIIWKSMAPAIASVDATGKVTGMSAAANPVQIIASANLSPTKVVADTVTLTILPAPAARVVVALSKATIEVGETMLAKAVLLDKWGNEVQGLPCSWKSDKPTILSVSADGSITGLAVGKAVLTGTSGVLSGSATVDVVPAAVASVVLAPSDFSLFVGQTQRLTIEVRDKRGALLTDRAVAWSSSDPSVAGIDSGIVTGTGAGGATVSAVVGGKTAKVIVLVTWSTRPVQNVVVKLAKYALDVGHTTTATAVLTDWQGYLLNGRAIGWSSSNPAIASVDASGAVTATGEGGAFIRATSEGKTGEALITITAPPWIPGDHLHQVVPERGAHEIGAVGLGQILAQTFMPNDDRWLGYVSLPVFCPAQGELTVNIRSGVAGTVLYSTTVTGLPTAPGGPFTMIQLFNPAISSIGVPLSGGTSYAIEISSPTAPTIGSCGISSGPAPSWYTGGAAYHKEGGSGWVMFSTNEDLPFVTFIRR